MVVSWLEPARTPEMDDWVRSGIGSEIDLGHLSAMEPASDGGMPGDVLIVEDDPIIALDFEDTILGFGVTRLRTARSVAKALEMIAERAPDFALLDVGLVREKSFAIAERLEALTIPFIFVTGYGSPGTFPAAFAHKPTLPKPYSSDALRALLTSLAGRKLTPGATCP